MFQVIITNEVPAFRDTSVKACQYDGLLRRIYVLQLVASNFAKNRKNFKRELFSNANYYFFFHYCLLSCSYAMLQKNNLSKPKWEAQAVIRGARPPGPPRGGQGGTMTPGPMDFGGPMGFRRAHELERGPSKFR